MTITRRITSTMLNSMPPHTKAFNARLYAIVPRKQGREVGGEYGNDVRLDPCVLDWEAKTITITAPPEINPGVSEPGDLHEDFFEAIQAAFLALAHACA